MVDPQRLKDTTLGVRCDPAFRAEIKAAADRYFDGNESDLMREAARLFIALRRKLGPQYEPTLHLLLGDALDAAPADLAPAVA